MSGNPFCVHCQLDRIHETQQQIESTLRRMETALADETSEADVIKSRIAEIHGNVSQQLNQVRAQVSPDGQAVLDQITAALEQLDQQVAGKQPGTGPEDGAPTAQQLPATDRR